MSSFLCSCWDRQEINDVAIVLTSAIDLEDDGTYRISHLLPLPRQLAGATQGGSSGGKAYYVDSESALSITDALFKVQQRMARHIALSHRRTIILGEDLARQGIDFLFDFFPRYFENRLSTLLIISQGKGADLLQADPKLERFPSEAIRELVYAISGYPIDIRQVGIALSFDSDPVVPYFTIEEVGSGKESSKEVKHAGYAQFRHHKMVGIYQDNDMHGLLWLLNHPREYMLNIPHENETILTLHVVNGQTAITPQWQNGQFHYHIQVNANLRLRGDPSKQNIMLKANVESLEQQSAKEIKKQIEGAITQMHKKSTDSAQLAQMTWRKFPNVVYHEVLTKWHEQFQLSSTTIHVNAKVIDSGLIYKNIVDRKLP